MQKYIYSSDAKLVQSVKDVPECGRDYCDSCGDCLHCYGETECSATSNKKHFWVEYLNETYQQHNFGFIEHEPVSPRE